MTDSNQIENYCLHCWSTSGVRHESLPFVCQFRLNRTYMEFRRERSIDSLTWRAGIVHGEFIFRLLFSIDHVTWLRERTRSFPLLEVIGREIIGWRMRIAVAVQQIRILKTGLRDSPKGNRQILIDWQRTDSWAIRTVSHLCPDQWFQLETKKEMKSIIFKGRATGVMPSEIELCFELILMFARDVTSLAEWHSAIDPLLSFDQSEQHLSRYVNSIDQFCSRRRRR